jgi:hypothetical protein
MRARCAPGARRRSPSAPARAERAESLPVVDGAVDGLTITIGSPRRPGWANCAARRGPVVVDACELDCLRAWQRGHLRGTGARAAALGGRTRVEPIATPGDCVDGIFGAFWRRPEALLDAAVRSAHSRCARCCLRDPSSGSSPVSWPRSSPAHRTASTTGHLREQEAFAGALAWGRGSPGASTGVRRPQAR